MHCSDRPSYSVLHFRASTHAIVEYKTLRLETFSGVFSAPRYAILSHTWDEDEVLFDDVHKADPSSELWKKKGGAEKVINVARNTAASDDSLDYIWIDYCCIDKSSSAELSAAINSMYRYYQRSEICTRHTLSAEIRAATGIDLEVLHSLEREIDTNPLIRTSVHTRMSWAARRDTTRPEDITYCLLDYFDVNMPLLYGEGAENAFERLQARIAEKSDDQSLLLHHADRFLTKNLLASAEYVGMILVRQR
ncbi:HET-domain-containing protein [Xylariaceae sp. FL1272]|nr:HET-domain-containing protein [Xylariaceae sp. FL1272]